MKIMSIGYNTLIDGKAASGRERLLLDISNRFISQGVDVKVYFGKIKGTADKYIYSLPLLFNILVYILRIASEFFDIALYKRRWLSELLFDFFLSFKLRKEYDCIVTTNPWIPMIARKAKKYNIKVVLLAGNPSDNVIFDLIKKEKLKIGLENEYDSFDSSIRLEKYNQFAMYVDSVITINNFTATTYLNDINFKNCEMLNVSLVQIVPNDSVQNQMEVLSDSTVLKVLYIAHTSTLKGLHYLLEAVELMNLEVRKVKLMIGGSIDVPFLKFISNKYPNANKDFEFLGPINSNQKSNYFEKCDVFVTPSLIDMGPVTVLEAMIHSRPVILTENCGNKWLIEEAKNGFIVKAGNSKELFVKLKWCYKNKIQLSDMGKRAFDTLNQAFANNEVEIDRMLAFIKEKI